MDNLRTRCFIHEQWLGIFYEWDYIGHFCVIVLLNNTKLKQLSFASKVDTALGSPISHDGEGLLKV